MPAASTTYWATPLQLDKASQPIPYWVLFVTIAVAILTEGPPWPPVEAVEPETEKPR